MAHHFNLKLDLPPATPYSKKKKKKKSKGRHLLYFFLLCILFILLAAGTTGSLLFKIAVQEACKHKNLTCEFQGTSICPVGFFKFSSWCIKKKNIPIIKGGKLSGHYFSTLSKHHFYSKGQDFETGKAFGDFFSDKSKIPIVKLHYFETDVFGEGKTEQELLQKSHGKITIALKLIVMPHSRLLARVSESTGFDTDKYLKFDDGILTITKNENTAVIDTPKILSGPYQVLDIDGTVNLNKMIQVDATLGLKPGIMKFIHNEKYIKPFIPNDWDGKSIIMLPAPITITGTVENPKIDTRALIDATYESLFQKETFLKTNQRAKDLLRKYKEKLKKRQQ
ncbi:MAG: hypothetical protein WCS73_05895 [Lentisphaeria bacterium]